MQAPAPAAAGKHTPVMPQPYLESEEIDRYTALFKRLIEAGSNISKKDHNFKMILREEVASNASEQEFWSRHSEFITEYFSEQRILLEKVYEMVGFLRAQGETIDWECDTQKSLHASSELLSQWVHLDEGKGIELNARLTNQLQDYIDHSSPAQLHSAFYLQVQQQASPLSEKSSDQIVQLATNYAKTYENLQSCLSAWRTSETLEKGYGELSGRIKALGEASKRFKEVTLGSLTRDFIDDVYTTRRLTVELAQDKNNSTCTLQ